MTWAHSEIVWLGDSVEALERVLTHLLGPNAEQHEDNSSPREKGVIKRPGAH